MDNKFGKLSFNPIIIDERLTKKISLWEFVALVFATSILVGFLIIEPNALHYDLNNYLKTATGDFSYYFYAYWFIPVFELFGKLPILISYFLWDIVSIFCIFLAARIFGGNPVLALVSYQMCYILFQGQMTGWIIGALAFLWWGMAHRKWSIAGIFFLISSTKFQSGLIFAVILLFLADISWRNRLQVIRLPIIVIVFSLILSPGWPFQLLSVIQNNPPNDWGSMALWQWIGPFALLLWIPPVLLPIPREKRLIALISTATLGLPYFQQADLLALFVFPISWFPIVGNFGFLSIWFGYNALHLLAVIPLVIYLIIMITSIRTLFNSRRNQAISLQRLNE